MSFREIRNLTEHLRVLGFPRLVSLENFSSPNFQLVSEILTWAAASVASSSSSLPTDIDTQRQRVALVTSAAVFFYQTLGVQLNTRRLYGADKLAARELLKVSSVLYRATQSLQPALPDGPTDPPTTQHSTQISIKEILETRRLASSIIQDAATLSDRLQRDVDGKVQRRRAVGEVLDLDRLEACVVASLHSLAASLDQVKDALSTLAIQEQEIEEKIQRKKESLARKKKRLETLNKIRPTWFGEFQREEEELREVWQEYVTKHINLAHLEEQLLTLTTNTTTTTAPAAHQGSGASNVPPVELPDRGAAKSGWVGLEEGARFVDDFLCDEDDFLDDSLSEEDNTLSLS